MLVPASADDGTSGPSMDDPSTTSPVSTSATTATPSDESTGAEEASQGGSQFLPPDDANGSSIGCNPWTGEPCEPGEKCMPWDSTGGGGWNASKCSPIAPDPAGPGEPCTVEGSGVSGVDDCEAFSMCWGVDPRTLQGTCVPFCIGSEANPSCANPCDRCSLSSSGVLIPCLPTCDPLEQNCPDGQACYGYGNHFVCAPYAGGPDAGHAGSPCEYLNVCQPGLFCASAYAVEGCQGSSGCCAPYCDLTEATPCPTASPGTECVPWYDKDTAPVSCNALDRVGACIVPN